MAAVDLAKLPTVEEAKADPGSNGPQPLTPKPPQKPRNSPRKRPNSCLPNLAQKLEQPPPARRNPQWPSNSPRTEARRSRRPGTGKTRPRPRKTPELQALKKAIADRHAKEVRKWADFHALELRQLEHELRPSMNAGKADDFAAIQAEEMAALKDRQKQHRTGIKGVLDAIQSKLNPTLTRPRRPRSSAAKDNCSSRPGRPRSAETTSH